MKDQINEMKSGGADTHELAVAAKAQSQQAELQTKKMAESVAKTDDLIRQASAQAKATNDVAVAARKQADAALNQSRLDQRAWVSLSLIPDVPLTDNRNWDQPIRLINSGKTPAKKLDREFVSLLVGPSYQPTFTYDHGTSVPHGTMFPNEPETVASRLIPPGYPKGTIPPPIVMSEQTRERLGRGEFFILTYGSITYTDVFGDSHWVHFCSVGPRETVLLYSAANKCYEYNDDDTNVPQTPTRN